MASIKNIIVTSSCFIWMILYSCQQTEKQPQLKTMNTSNPAVYFEIPVNDLERAQKFYTLKKLMKNLVLPWPNLKIPKATGLHCMKHFPFNKISYA